MVLVKNCESETGVVGGGSIVFFLGRDIDFVLCNGFFSLLRAAKNGLVRTGVASRAAQRLVPPPFRGGP